ncbi:AAA family ATPase [Actinosynnema sp. NPDC020468]|uniref:AAA family ATPase n=1 Tax=Actinosynnema sp. NPDC020468 TaxID=3154488 RepID=UPI0033F3E2D8
MYGPPGCGKTFIARAIAGDLGASFIHVTLADLLGKWIGESEKASRSLFRNARAAPPGVIFLDVFDALGGRRSSGTRRRASPPTGWTSWPSRWPRRGSPAPISPT